MNKIDIIGKNEEKRTCFLRKYIVQYYHIFRV